MNVTLTTPDDAPSQPHRVSVPETIDDPAATAAAPRFPQLIPIAQLVAIVAGVLGIIWSQQQGIDNLRTELTADINRLETTLRAEFSDEIGGLRTEIGGLRAEIGGLRAEVSENGQRLARIEGHLGIGVPDDSARMTR